MAPRVEAGLITYDPNLEEVARVIDAVYEQVDWLIIVDNASSNVSEVERLIAGYSRATLLRNSSNEGVAFALNQIMAHAEHSGADWVLTLDQDSIVSELLVQRLVRHADAATVGIVCPRVVDRNYVLRGTVDQGVRSVSECITSGSLTSVSAWRSVGQFDTKLFIDFVDFEFCCRLRIMGFEILQVLDVTLSHKVGNATTFRLLGVDLVAYHHPPLRKFYFARNLVYHTRKHRGNVESWRLYVALGKLTVITLALEDQKVQKFVAIVRGVRAGLTMQPQRDAATMGG